VVGAFGLLAVTANMLSMIGMILLTGLVGRNAILLVDFTNTLRKRGLSRNKALLQAGPTRPILMTTSALVLAMLPIALKLGEGAEWRAPMAVTVIGGLLTSTLLTLVLIPAVYTIMDDLSGLLARSALRTHARELEAGAAARQCRASGPPTAEHVPAPGASSAD
jgi:HAE1 family hydrophobic/amphiphilic exporter-1